MKGQDQSSKVHMHLETVVKVAESVNHAVAPTATAASSPPDAASPVGTPPPPPHVATGRTAARKKAARHGRRKTAARKKATRAVDKGPTRQITARKSSAQANIDDSTVAPHSPVSDTPRETSHRSTEIDMGVTPADSVKKRRRTTSWKIGVNGPTIVSVPDDEGDKSIKRPRKNKSQSGITGVGQDFKDVSEFRDVLQKYAVAHRSQLPNRSGLKSSLIPTRVEGNRGSLLTLQKIVLLTATALDGDDGFFPVAFAIVDVENDDHWLWFLEQLKSALPNMETITFVSDREKGLKEHLVKVFGNAYHGYSLYHLLESFKKNLKGPFHGDGRGSLPVNFVAAAHAIRLVGFKKFVEQIKQVSSHSYDWVMQIEPEYWTNALFKGERYIQITQNVAELYIKVMEEARNSTITLKIGALVSMITELVNTRQEDSSNWCTKLTPSKHEKVQEEIAHALGLKVLFSSDTLFEVHDDVNHVVDLNKLECTCLGWKSTGLPCRHAIAVFNSTRRTVYDYCSKYFTVDSYRSTYSESINPVPCGKPAEEEEEEGTESDNVHVLPPCPSRSPNQPKTKEAKREGPAKRVVFCSRCKESGHNKASCKAAL
ncbi:hypothetical protein RHGRI_000483 [Rhododendron griersonianum]|uniref:SWIM-type domain-containing protein n=1 Tax=Rhododendron griersonianum TaxID=479676 RepID=A0AAV6LK04_9ERIC|nr:hypothetical protein RHGRI_000483 [Rhododendron griersonianum]